MEEYNLSDLLLKNWIERAVYHNDAIKVKDLHGWWMLVDSGKYLVHKHGHTKRRYTSTKERLAEILFATIVKTCGFERKGYRYTYDRGRWVRYAM